jgi:hypothetical protein
MAGPQWDTLAKREYGWVFSLEGLPSAECLSMSLSRQDLLEYGIKEPVMLSNAASPDLIDYLDLLPADTQKNSESVVLPEAVAERQGRPLLYVVSKANLSSPPNRSEQKSLRQLRRTLGSRGEQAYLGILEPGQLSVRPINLCDRPPEATCYKKGTGQALTFFSRLSMGEYDGKEEPSSPDYVFDAMIRLLERIADELVGQHNVNKDDVLSLIGRALFFRFLCDRKVLKPQSLRSVSTDAANLRDCFKNARSAASTSAWLDRTFNGDFLPLTLTDQDNLAFFDRMEKRTSGQVFSHLSAILNDDESAGGVYQQKFHWAKFDFAHVPVGLLSQVYEKFSQRWSPDAKATSVHYTPRRLAEYLVEEAFVNLPNAASARVLDPACGAGVFLVLAFRRLYQARWKAEGRRPDTSAIRRILENQIAGFEVSESALRLTALSLYLTAIELDPQPTPPSKLGFNDLRGRVLFNCRRPEPDDPTDGPVIGSLGNHVGKEHTGAYDLVLCNPPWTSLKTKPKRGSKNLSLDMEVAGLRERYQVLAAEYTRVSREVLTRRGLDAFALEYQNPDNVPDLPFVWRSMEWCRSRGRIGMVLPGRILFKQEAVPRRAREILFQSVAINGILNCSNLTGTQVWPNMNQPFLLLFAENQIPKANHRLRWVTPHFDLKLNHKGEVRIDSKSVELVDIQTAIHEPWLWKALAIGTALDVDVTRKLKLDSTKPLLQYWKKELKLATGKGYSVETAGQQDASRLHDLWDLSDTSLFRFKVHIDKLQMFSLPKAGRPRELEIYRKPLVLVKGFPGLTRSKGWALLSLNDVAFKKNFYGYSGAGNENGEELVRYLQLFVHSYIWMHLVLMKSPKMGVERREFYKDDLDTCPFIPLEILTTEQRKSITSLSQRLIALDTTATDDPILFRDIDTFFAGLYGLNKFDAEVIRDTIETSMPFKDARLRASECPTPPQRELFMLGLQTSLRPFVRKLGKEVQVSLWQPRGHVDLRAPYSAILVGIKSKTVNLDERTFCDQVLSLASESGASLVIHEEDNGLVVAILKEYRYWTPSRARLCAGEILLRHMAVFEG